jgi:hypothetical protein
MSVEVIILLNKSTEPLATGDQAWHEPRLHNIDHLRWAKLTTEIAKRAAGNAPYGVDVYLHFNGDHLASTFDYDFVEKLVELAREHTWGGKVFLVFDQGIFKDPDQIKSNMPSIAYWLETVQRGSVADVVLASHSRLNPNSPTSHLLNRIGIDSLTKERDLFEMVTPGLWSYWAPTSSAINRFKLFDESLFSARRVRASNFLIAVDRKASISTAENIQIRRFVRKHSGRQFALAVVGIAASALSPDLEDLAARLSLRVMTFRGWLELRFFLLRLNHLCAAQAVLAPETTKARPVTMPPRFDNSIKKPPRLLVTNSFSHQQDPLLCREAARDIGKLLHLVHPRAEYLIHPALRGSALPGLLTKLHDATVWWFMGHGQGTGGLQDVDGQVLRPKDWISKFSAWNKCLPLVFFSACRSAEIAGAFAEAGAGVAIGFESDTLPGPCRMLAIRVIEAALTSYGERNAILTAFSAGCRSLQISGLGHIKPRAFYAAH